MSWISSPTRTRNTIPATRRSTAIGSSSTSSPTITSRQSDSMSLSSGIRRMPRRTTSSASSGCRGRRSRSPAGTSGPAAMPPSRRSPASRRRSSGPCSSASTIRVMNRPSWHRPAGLRAGPTGPPRAPRQGGRALTAAVPGPSVRKVLDRPRSATATSCRRRTTGRSSGRAAGSTVSCRRCSSTTSNPTTRWPRAPTGSVTWRWRRASKAGGAPAR